MSTSNQIEEISFSRKYFFQVMPKLSRDPISWTSLTAPAVSYVAWCNATASLQTGVHEKNHQPFSAVNVTLDKQAYLCSLQEELQK